MHKISYIFFNQFFFNQSKNYDVEFVTHLFVLCKIYSNQTTRAKYLFQCYKNLKFRKHILNF